MGIAVAFSLQTRTTGSWYAEVVPAAVGGLAELSISTEIGVTYQAAPSGVNVPSGEGVGVQPNGSTLVDGLGGENVAPYVLGDVVMIAFDAVSGLVWFGVNGTWTGDPELGTGAANASAPISGSPYAIYINHPLFTYSTGEGVSAVLNAKASQQTYPVPTGFSPWEDE